MSLNIGDLVASVQIDLGDASTQLDDLVSQFAGAAEQIQTALGGLSETIDNIGGAQTSTENPFEGLAQDAETTGTQITDALDTSVSQASDSIQQQLSTASQDASTSLDAISSTGEQAFATLEDSATSAASTLQDTMSSMSDAGQQDMTGLTDAVSGTGSMFDSVSGAMAQGQMAIGTAGLAASGGLFTAMETGNQLANTYERLEGLTGENADQTASMIAGFAGAGLQANQAQMMIMRLQMRIGGLSTAYDTQTAKIKANIDATQAAMDQGGLTQKQYDTLKAKLEGYQNQLAMLPETFNSASNASNVLAQIGVNWQDASGKALPLTQLMPQIIDGMREMEKTDPAHAAMIGMRLFGRQFTQMIPMIQAGGDAYTAAADSAKKTGDVLTQAQVDNAHKLEVAKAQLQDTFSSAAAEISKSFTPIITSVVNTVDTIIQKFNNMSPSSKAFVEQLLKLIAVFGTALGGATAVATVLEKLGGVAGPLGGIFGKLGGGIEMFLGPIGFAVAALGALHMAGVNIQPVLSIAEGVLRKVAEAIGAVLTWLNKAGVLVPIIMGITGALIAWKVAMGIQALIQGASMALYMFQAGLEGVAAAEVGGETAAYSFGAALDFALGPVGLIIAGIAAAIAIGVLLATHWKDVENIAKGVWTTVSNAVTGFFKSAMQFLQPFFNAVKDIFDGVVDVISTTIGVIVADFTTGWNVITGIVSVAVKVISTIIGIIVTIVRGVLAVMVPIWRTEWNIISTIVSIAIHVIAAIIETIVNLVKLPLAVIGALFQLAWLAITAIVKVAIGIIGAIISPIADVVGAVVGVVTNIFKIGFDLVVGYLHIWYNIYSTVIGAIVNVVSAVVGTVVNVFRSGIGTISDVIRGIIGTVANIVGPIIGFFGSIASGITNTFSGVANVVGSIIGGIVGVVKGIANGVIDAIDFVIGVVDSIKIHVDIPGTSVGINWDGLNIPKIPRLAEGGIVPATPGGMLALLGEGGKAELVTPLDESGKPMGGAGSGENVTINQTFNSANMDPFQVGREVGWTMKTRLR